MLDREEQEISQIIDEGLEAILTGEASMGEVLRKHPQVAATLQPEIEAALWLMVRERQVASRSNFISESRARIVNRVLQESQSRGTRRSFLSFLSPSPQSTFQWVAVVIFLIVIITGMGGVLSISQNALPGEPLYAIKRISEDVAVDISISDERKADLRAEFIERRFEEVEALVEKEDYSAAMEALSEFEHEVNQAVILLQQVSDGKPEKKRNLANQMQSDLTRFAQRLDDMKLNAPDNFRANLERAKDTSINGASIATAVYENIQEEESVKGTPGQVEPGTAGTVPPDDSTRPQTDPEEDAPRFTKTPKPADKDLLEKETKPTKKPKPDKEDETTDALPPVVEEEPPDTPVPLEEVEPTKKVKPTKEEKDK